MQNTLGSKYTMHTLAQISWSKHQYYMVPQETAECHSPVPARSLFLCLPSPHAVTDRIVHLETTRQGQEATEKESQEKAATTDGEEASRYSLALRSTCPSCKFYLVAMEKTAGWVGSVRLS